MVKPKIKFFPTLLVGLFLIFWVLLLSGNILWTSNQPPLMVISDMDDQNKVKPQDKSNFFPDGGSVRPPVEGTVPRNGSLYTVESTDEAEAANVNTVPPTAFVLARGKNRFNTLCAPCHAKDAAGNGLVVQRGFTPPPSLLRPETKALSDGRLYHVISFGQNIMPSYADKLSPVDRWAVVHYLRTLQGIEPGSEATKRTAAVSAAPAQSTDTATTAN